MSFIENIKDNLEIFKDKNIFLIDRKKITQVLNKFDFINYFIIDKIFPSKIKIFVKKAELLGVTYVNEDKFYIGSNGKLISALGIENEKNLPIVFGKFSINKFLELQKIIASQNFDLSKIVKYSYFKSKRWDIEFLDGIKLRLPFQNIEDSLKFYKILKDNNKIDSSNIVDLRLLNRIILSNEKK